MRKRRKKGKTWVKQALGAVLKTTEEDFLRNLGPEWFHSSLMTNSEKAMNYNRKINFSPL